MSNNQNRPISPYRGGVFQNLTMQIKLVLRLMGDPRVSPFLKLIPIGSVVYFIIPDIAPGPIDDAAVIGLGLYLFVELCPPDVVEEHKAELQRTIPGEWHDPQEGSQQEEEVIDAEFREEK
jgi:uncharacterized membrane protein YkvA (DUF1232 family)